MADGEILHSDHPGNGQQGNPRDHHGVAPELIGSEESGQREGDGERGACFEELEDEGSRCTPPETGAGARHVIPATVT